MRKVFVCNDSGHNFSSAKDFGELVIMTSDVIKRFDVTAMLRTFKEAFKDASEDDYILQSGPTVMNIIAGSLFARKFGRLNLLLWKANNRGGPEYYVSRKLVFKENKTTII